MKEKFYINFKSDNTGEVQIDEPFGFSNLKFDINQKEKGYARDIFFNGGEAMMEFGNRRNHYLDKLLYYFHYYGFEANAQIRIEFSNGENVIMDLDFYSAVTDDLEYFRCKCIEISEVQIVNRRASVKVDLFSDRDIDGNTITPVQTQSILLKPKALFKSSIWNQVPFNNVTLKAEGGVKTVYNYVNPCANIIQNEISHTLSWFEINSTSPENFYLIEAADNMSDIKLKIEGLNIHFTTDTDNGGNGYVDMNLILGYGKMHITTTPDIIFGTPDNKQVLLSTHQTEGKTYDFTGDFNINIDALNRGDRIFLYFEFKIRQSATAINPRFEVFTTISQMKTTVSAVTKSYYSTTKGIRLIDAVKQVCKSISGKDVTAPLLGPGSLYYNTMLFNGNLLRGIIDKPFYLSLEDLENSLSTEMNGDFETAETIFFGHERDFYTSNEIWFFDNTQFSDFNKKVNERVAINEFSIKYTNFQSQKENEITNSGQIVHGECKMTFFNKMVENKRDVSIDWIRDPFMIEEARNKSLEITSDTYTQNSDDVFAIDTISNFGNIILKETTLLYHEYHGTSGNLVLRTKTEPNFLTLGLSVGDRFDIMAPDKNAGGYEIISIQANSLELKPKGYPAIIGIRQSAIAAGKPNSNNNGERLTTYKYNLNNINYPFRNRTNEEITNISGVNSPDSFSNFRYTIRRNIENNYSEYLSTCNIYWKENPIKVTWYKNNRDCEFTYNGLTTKEGADYLPNNPILSPWVYDNAIFANVDLEDVVLIRNAIKTQRGFIRCIDKTGNVIKLYPKRMSYDSLSKELNIMGEGKYEPISMLIETDNDGFITINKETSIFTENFDWEIIDHKLYVYDNHRQRLYNGVFWDLVSINGGFAKSEDELKELLNLL